MNHKENFNIRYAVFLLILMVSACVGGLQSSNLPTSTRTETYPMTDTISIAPTLSTSVLGEASVQSPASFPPTVQELTTTPSSHSSLSAMVTPSIVPEATPVLEGPLIGFRVHDDDSIYLLLFDISVNTIREIRNSSINYPFEVEWVDSGCGLYMGDIIDLTGNVIWETPTLDWEHLMPHADYGGEFRRLSPNRQWLAYDILYGEKYYEGAEFRDIGVVNLTRPSEFTLLTSDGSASLFAWSPDSEWLTFAHKDEKGITQLYRARPDGQDEQQLTFHAQPFGVGFVTWSPDGRFIAYAIFGEAEGKPSGVGIVDLENSRQVQILPHENFVGVRRGEMWWEFTGSRLLFSGTSWNGEEEVTEIFWARWVDRNDHQFIYWL